MKSRSGEPLSRGCVHEFYDARIEPKGLRRTDIDMPKLEVVGVHKNIFLIRYKRGWYPQGCRPPAHDPIVPETYQSRVLCPCPPLRRKRIYIVEVNANTVRYLGWNRNVVFRYLPTGEMNESLQNGKS